MVAERPLPLEWSRKAVDLEEFYGKENTFVVHPASREEIRLPFKCFAEFSPGLTRRSVRCRRIREKYDPPPASPDFVVRRKQVHDLYFEWVQQGALRSIWNESVASCRLMKYDDKTHQLRVEFCESNSYDGLATDLNPDLLHKDWDGTAREICKSDLMSERRFLSVSNIGLSAMIETSDDKVLIQVKSPGLTMGGRFASSCEGGMKYDDIDVFDGMIREIDEELHIRDTEINHLSLLMISRNLEWNARPDFHFLVKTYLTESQIKDKEARDRWEFEKLRFVPRDDSEEIVSILYDTGTRVFPKATMVAYLRSRFPGWGEVKVPDLSENSAKSSTEPTSETSQFIRSLSVVSLSYYRVLGGYYRHDERARNLLKDFVEKIEEDLSRSHTTGNYLVWSRPGTGKTYFVRQIAKKLGEGVRFAECNAAIDGQDEFKERLLETKSDRPVLALIDEIDSLVSADWVYDWLLPYLDSSNERGTTRVTMLSGSTGKSIEDFKARIMARPKGADVLSRIPAENEITIPLLTDPDRVILALAAIVNAGTEGGKVIDEVERMALYYIGMDRYLSDARRVSEFIKKSITRMPKLEQRLKYDYLFEAGDQNRLLFWESVRAEASDFVNSFVVLKD